MAGNPAAGMLLYNNGVVGPGPLVQGNVIRDTTLLGVDSGGFASGMELLDNVVEHHGGGITVNSGGNTTVRNNVIRFNSGKGLWLLNVGDQLVVGNVIAFNLVEVDYTVPSGSRGPYLVNNTIVAPSGTAVSSDQRFGAPALYNNVIYSGASEALTCDGGPSPTTANNVLYRVSGGPVTACAGVLASNGNLSVNPILVNPGGGDFRLAGISPAVDVGSNVAPSLPALDADGHARIIDGDGDGSAVIGIGAYETVIGPGVAPNPSPVDFGSLPPGQGAAGTVNLTGVGRLPAHVSGVAVTGAGFALVSNGCTGAAATLPALVTCTVGVRFTPTGPGTFTGTLTFLHDGRAGRTDVPIVAVSQPPQPSKFVRAAYLSALGREPTLAEFTFWDARLAAGLARDAFALALVATPEHRRVQLASYFNLFLQRPPNPAVDPFEAMVTLTAPGLYPIELMAAVLLGSDEYFEFQSRLDFRFGDPPTPNVRFVKGLFSDVLAQVALNGDPALTFWVDRVNGGQSRLSVALGFLYTPTFLERYVRSLYQDLIGRPADAAGLQFWVGQLLNGMRTDTVRAYFLGSAEYYNRVNAGG